MEQIRHPLSPRLDHCPEGLPRAAYLEQNWFAREMAAVFGRQWVCVGRLADIAPGTQSRVQIGLADCLLCRLPDGTVSAFHNSCQHRGSSLCREAIAPLGKMIRCPYHAWSYAAEDGRLLATGLAKPTADFDTKQHGLHKVAVRHWNGFVFLNAQNDQPELHADVPLISLDNWPMDDLVTGHRWQHHIACNWKVFWENYSECLHCPGVHPELCDLVPIYRAGLMGTNEALDWTPDISLSSPLKAGAKSWTSNGAFCGPVFPGITTQEQEEGYRFVTLWPSAYVVAHADYVRSVRIEPLSPERTRITAEWHFAPATLAQDGFDVGRVAEFAITVLSQDADAAELNQIGIRSPTFQTDRLMPEEYEIHRFQQWILTQMEAHHE